MKIEQQPSAVSDGVAKRRRRTKSSWLTHRHRCTHIFGRNAKRVRDRITCAWLWTFTDKGHLRGRCCEGHQRPDLAHIDPPFPDTIRSRCKFRYVDPEQQGKRDPQSQEPDVSVSASCSAESIVAWQQWFGSDLFGVRRGARTVQRRDVFCLACNCTHFTIIAVNGFVGCRKPLVLQRIWRALTEDPDRQQKGLDKSTAAGVSGVVCLRCSNGLVRCSVLCPKVTIVTLVCARMFSTRVPLLGC